jgi:hypothetical protein
MSYHLLALVGQSFGSACRASARRGVLAMLRVTCVEQKLDGSSGKPAEVPPHALHDCVSIWERGSGLARGDRPQ